MIFLTERVVMYTCFDSQSVLPLCFTFWIEFCCVPNFPAFAGWSHNAPDAAIKKVLYDLVQSAKCVV